MSRTSRGNYCSRCASLREDAATVRRFYLCRTVVQPGLQLYGWNDSCVALTAEKLYKSISNKKRRKSIQISR